VTTGDVVRVVLLFYLMPVWSVLLAWLILGDRPRPVALARIALALAGVWTVLGTDAGGIPWPDTLPDYLGLVGGLGFAFTNIMLRRLGDGPAGPRLLAMFCGGGVLAGTVAALGTAQGLVPAVPSLALAWLAGLALLAASFFAGNLGLQYGAARLPAHTTALVMLSEVVFASLSAVALGASELTSRSLAGGLLILAAAAWSAWPQRVAAPAA
jgi:drug/metabolite transporter (DMT)-like permease